MKTCPVCGSSHEKPGAACSRSCGAKNRSYKERECAFPSCDKLFRPSSPTPFCSPTHHVACEACGEETEVRSEPRFTRKCAPCGAKAGRERAKLTNLERRGVEHHFASDEVKEKIRATNLERYGVENSAQTEEVKERIRATNLERYGETAPILNEEVREKWMATNRERFGTDYAIASETVRDAMRKTNLARYGVEYGLAAPEVRAKIKATNQALNGVDNVFSRADIQEKIRETSLARYGVEHAMQNPEVSQRAQATLSARINAGETFHHRVSKLNRAFQELVQETFGVRLELEVPFGPYFADLGNDDVLIELNPTVSHNSAMAFQCLVRSCSLPCEDHAALPSSYHEARAKAALAENRRLIQLYDWNSPEASLKLLASSLQRGWVRHSARKLKLREIKPRKANSFMADAHVQGAVRGQSHCYGLFDGKDLIAVATFGPSRFGATETWEWLRYAVKPGHVVNGGPNKFFRAFLDEGMGEGSSVISYVDFDHTTRQSIFLEQCGFTEERLTGPRLVWSRAKSAEAISDSALRRLGADRLLGTSYGSREESGMSNKDIMAREGFLPVYASGNRVFVWRGRASAEPAPWQTWA